MAKSSGDESKCSRPGLEESGISGAVERVALISKAAVVPGIEAAPR